MFSLQLWQQLELHPAVFGGKDPVGPRTSDGVGGSFLILAHPWLSGPDGSCASGGHTFGGPTTVKLFLYVGLRWDRPPSAGSVPRQDSPTRCGGGWPARAITDRKVRFSPVLGGPV